MVLIIGMVILIPFVNAQPTSTIDKAAFGECTALITWGLTELCNVPAETASDWMVGFVNMIWYPVSECCHNAISCAPHIITIILKDCMFINPAGLLLLIGSCMLNFIPILNCIYIPCVSLGTCCMIYPALYCLGLFFNVYSI